MGAKLNCAAGLGAVWCSNWKQDRAGLFSVVAVGQAGQSSAGLRGCSEQRLEVGQCSN